MAQVDEHGFSIPDDGGAAALPDAGFAPIGPPAMRLAPAFAGALVAAAAGAVAWWQIAMRTDTEFALLAIGIGALSGFLVSKLGAGPGSLLGAIGASGAAAGIVGGKYLLYAMSVVPEIRAAGLSEVPGFASFMRSSAGPMDLLFMGVALWEGYRIPKRRTPA